MTIRHMRIFVAVVHENSITGAAGKLYLSQPAVSLAVRELEEYYGVRLFERMSRRIFVTEAGRKLYDYATHIVSLFEEMEAAMHDCGDAGPLRIGASVTIGTQLMSRYIKRFAAHFPDISPYVFIDSSDVIEEKILQNELDFGLVEGQVQSDANLISEVFSEDELVVVCALDHPLRRKEKVTLEDLKSENFLLREKSSGTRELVESILAVHGISVQPIWDSTSTLAIINAVADGLGISILPARMLKSYYSERRLARLDVENLELRRPFSVIYHKNKYLTHAATAFIEMVKTTASEMGEMEDGGGE